MNVNFNNQLYLQAGNFFNGKRTSSGKKPFSDTMTTTFGSISMKTDQYAGGASTAAVGLKLEEEDYKRKLPVNR